MFAGWGDRSAGSGKERCGQGKNGKKASKRDGGDSLEQMPSGGRSPGGSYEKRGRVRVVGKSEPEEKVW